MRLTVNLPEQMKNEIKDAANNEAKSLSRFVTEAIRYYLHDKRRKELGNKVLRLVEESSGISPDIEEELERGRSNGDRA